MPKRVSSRNRLKKVIPLCQALCKLGDEEREALLSYLNSEGREALYECMHNCLYNKSIPKENRQELRAKLSGKAKVITYLAKAGNNLEKKRRMLQQHGGSILPIILSAALPLLLSLFSK
jgi:DNA primase catalytic subunit